MKLVRWLWSTTLFVFVRKILNTFRWPARIMGWMQGGREGIIKGVEVWLDDSHYKLDFYKELDEKTTAFVDYVDSHTEKKDRILDVCCNQGRFLLELKRRGYSELFGFDVMGVAIESLRKHDEFNDEVIHVEEALAQKYFDDKEDGQFDWAITYTATIELIHPEFDIFNELGRTVKKGMFLVLNENGHSYPRFYRLLHRLNGFKVVSIIPQGDNSVLIHSLKV